MVDIMSSKKKNEEESGIVREVQILAKYRPGVDLRETMKLVKESGKRIGKLPRYKQCPICNKDPCRCGLVPDLLNKQKTLSRPLDLLRSVESIGCGKCGYVMPVSDYRKDHMAFIRHRCMRGTG